MTLSISLRSSDALVCNLFQRNRSEDADKTSPWFEGVIRVVAEVLVVDVDPVFSAVGDDNYFKFVARGNRKIVVHVPIGGPHTADSVERFDYSAIEANANRHRDVAISGPVWARLKVDYDPI